MVNQCVIMDIHQLSWHQMDLLKKNNIKKVLALTHKTIEDVDFVESGSPGTKLGDPVEAHAIRNVFEKRTQPLYISSVKRNIGHLEMASGFADQY